MNGMELDLAYLCKEVREIARASATFLKEERRKFDRNLVEEKSAHNYVSYVDKESERQIIEALSTLLPEAGFIAEEGSGSLTDVKGMEKQDFLTLCGQIFDQMSGLHPTAQGV